MTVKRGRDLELGRLLVFRRFGQEKNDTVSVSRLTTVRLPEEGLMYRKFRITVRKEGNEVAVDRLGLQLYDGASKLYEFKLNADEKLRFANYHENVSYLLVHRGKPYELKNLYRRRNQDNQIVNKKSYLGTLNLLLRDCNYLSDKISSVAYTEAGLVKLLQQYDRCRGKRVGEALEQQRASSQNSRRWQLGFAMGGYQPYGGMVSEALGLSASLFVTGNLIRSNPRPYYRAEAGYFGGYYTWESITETGGTTFVERDFSGIMIPLVIGWRFVSESAALVPYLETGVHLRSRPFDSGLTQKRPEASLQFGGGINYRKLSIRLHHLPATPPSPKVTMLQLGLRLI